MKDEKSKFHFEGNSFDNNRGNINFGEHIEIHNHSTTVINKTEIRVTLQKLREAVSQAENMPTEMKRELLRVTDEVEQEIQKEVPNRSFLAKLNEQLLTWLPLLTAWQTVTSTISALCDLMPKG